MPNRSGVTGIASEKGMVGLGKSIPIRKGCGNKSVRPGLSVGWPRRASAWCVRRKRGGGAGGKKAPENVWGGLHHPDSMEWAGKGRNNTHGREDHVKRVDRKTNEKEQIQRVVHCGRCVIWVECQKKISQEELFEKQRIRNAGQGRNTN